MSPRVLAAFSALVLGGCESFPDPDGAPDFGGDDPPIASVTEVCSIMNQCGLWFGLESCEEELLTPESCGQRVAYLACMSECVEVDDCFSFDSCEAACWTAECDFGGSPAPF